jgi:hypothetical protein
LKEAPPKNYQSPEEEVNSAYTLRTIHRFFNFFGLAGIIEPERNYSGACDLWVTPIAYEVVKFMFPFPATQERCPITTDTPRNAAINEPLFS